MSATSACGTVRPATCTASPSTSTRPVSRSGPCTRITASVSSGSSGAPGGISRPFTRIIPISSRGTCTSRPEVATVANACSDLSDPTSGGPSPRRKIRSSRRGMTGGGGGHPSFARASRWPRSSTTGRAAVESRAGCCCSRREDHTVAALAAGASVATVTTTVTTRAELVYPPASKVAPRAIAWSELGDLAVLDRDRLGPPRDLHPVRAHGQADDLRAIAVGERRLAVRSQHVRAGAPSGVDPQDTDAEPRVVPGLDRHPLHTRPGDHHRVRPGEQIEALGSVAGLQAGGLTRLEDIHSGAPRVRACGEGHDEPAEPARQGPIDHDDAARGGRPSGVDRAERPRTVHGPS